MQAGPDAASRKLASYFLDNLKKIAVLSFQNEKPRDLVLAGSFIRHFLGSFVRDDFRPDRKQLLEFIYYNEPIANLVLIAGLRNTDAYVERLLATVQEPGILPKLLTLYSAHNTVEIPPVLFFDTDAEAASRWYYAYLGAVDLVSANKRSHANVLKLFNYTDARLGYSPTSMDHAYFGVTYLDESWEANTRRQIHSAFSKITPAEPAIINRPRRESIAVITARWVPGNVVYRALAPFIRDLSEHYELTLVHLVGDTDRIDSSMFARVINFSLDPEQPAIGALSPNDFSMVLFPDIGMNVESVYLASLRLAPVQVALCGHPVSTWSPVIDYFIHGADILDPKQARQQFGERLVLIPGCGQLAVKPDYSLTGCVAPADEIRIACCWSIQKVTHEHLLLLKQACELAKRPVKFVFFSAGSLSYLPLARIIRQALGEEHVEMTPVLYYQDYMARQEGCHFAVDSYPFGGFMTLMDLFWLRKPVVTLCGPQSYNRNAAYFLRRMGLDALIADTPQAFVQRLVLMINDENFRNQAIRQMRDADLDQAIFSRDAVPFFTKAVQMLQENHEQLRLQNSVDPIIVKSL